MLSNLENKMEIQKIKLRAKNGNFCNVETWFAEWAGDYYVANVCESTNNFSNAKDNLQKQECALDKLLETQRLVGNLLEVLQCFPNRKNTFGTQRLKISISSSGTWTLTEMDVDKAISDQKLEIYKQRTVLDLMQQNEVEVPK